MFERNTSKSRSFSGWAGTIGMLMVTTIATPAFAADTGFVTVQEVTFSNSATLMVKAGNEWYKAGTAIGNCPTYNVTADTLSAWQSQVTAALLSGKLAKIVYTTLTNCQDGTANFITGIHLGG